MLALQNGTKQRKRKNLLLEGFIGVLFLFVCIKIYQTLSFLNQNGNDTF